MTQSGVPVLLEVGDRSPRVACHRGRGRGGKQFKWVATAGFELIVTSAQWPAGQEERRGPPAQLLVGGRGEGVDRLYHIY